MSVSQVAHRMTDYHGEVCKYLRVQSLSLGQLFSCFGKVPNLMELDLVVGERGNCKGCSQGPSGALLPCHVAWYPSAFDNRPFVATVPWHSPIRRTSLLNPPVHHLSWQ